MGARIVIEKNIEIPMRDGCVLRGDLYRPDGAEKLPVLLNRTPYDKSFPLISALTLDAIRAAQRGYNVVFVDCRGATPPRAPSTASPTRLRTVTTPSSISRASHGPTARSGCSGRPTWARHNGSPRRPVRRSLKAIVPSITASDYHDGWTYQGGAFALFFNVSWPMITIGLARLMRERESNPDAARELNEVMASIDHMREKMDVLPLKEFPLFRNGAPYFSDWLNHPNYDDYWRKLCIEESHAKINIPALNLGGWYDIFQGGTIRNYPRYEGARRDRRGAPPAPDDGPVESCAAVAEPRRPGRYGLSRRRGLGRSRRRCNSTSSTTGSRASRTASPTARRSRSIVMGAQGVARRTGMAAAGHRMAPLLSA